MKNKILLCSSLFAGCLLLIMACHKIEDNDSQVISTSIPYVAFQFVEDAYVYGEGQTSIYSDLPDVLGIVVDTVVGFEGGYGGKTGMDSLKILKSEIDWPDTTSLGGKNITLARFNKANYQTSIATNIVIAGAIPNPGPTALEGNYLRAATGYILQIQKVFPGVYVVNNPGGAGTVAPFPYLLYNYRSSTGQDSLSFPIQPNPCHTATQLVSPTAPNDLTSEVYTAQHTPKITSMSPLTLSWKVFTFGAVRTTATHNSASVCQWGLAVRTFIKQ